MSALSVEEISRLLDGQVTGDATIVISGVAAFTDATATDLVFVTSESYLDAALACDAGCALVPCGLKVSDKTAIAVDHPRLAFARIAARLHPITRRPAGIHATAVIDPTAKIDPAARIGACVTIGERTEIRARATVDAGCSIADDITIGEDSTLRPRVVVYSQTQIGSRVLVHAGAVLGCDGFGFVRSPDGQIKFPQIGHLVIEDDVEIGANTTVDRGALGATLIRRGSKIDNQVQIAHNVEIGRDCALSAQVGIAGSARLDDRVTLGGQVGIGDHVHIGEDVMAGGQAGVPSGKKIQPGQVLWGTPARPLSEVKRQLAHLSHLAAMRDQIRALQAAVARLEASTDEDG